MTTYVWKRMNNRRKIIIGLGASALTAPFGSFAQQRGKIWRIGFLGASTADGFARPIDSLRAGLRDLGYIEGKNIVFEWRFAEGDYKRLPGLAAELARPGMDVIVTYGTPGTQAAKQATTIVPIVMAAIGDAIAVGVVSDLARPGGNITGTTFFNPELAAKRLEIIRDAIPRARRVAILLNPLNPLTEPILKALRPTANALKLELQQFSARVSGELEGAFASMAAKGMDAVATSEDSMIIASANRIAELSLKRRIPLFGFPDLADAGALLGYGVNFPELFRRAAHFVDKIFKGTKPGDLPVEQWNRYEIIVNLKTARMLGIKLPDLVLQRADRIIE